MPTWKVSGYTDTLVGYKTSNLAIISGGGGSILSSRTLTGTIPYRGGHLLSNPRVPKIMLEGGLCRDSERAITAGQSVN